MSRQRASIRSLGPMAALAACLIVLLTAFSATAAADPVFTVKTTWGDTHLSPGGQHELFLHFRNSGDADPSAPLKIEDQLPAGLTITNLDWRDWAHHNQAGAPNLTSKFCSGLGTSTLKCTVPAADAAELLPAPGVFEPPILASLWPSGYSPFLYIDVLVGKKASGTGTNVATVSGGGAAQSFADTDTLSFDPDPATFGLVPGSFKADAFDAAFPFGAPKRQAGSHPYELRVDFDLNEKTGFFENPGGIGSVVSARYTEPVGSIRTADVTLPRGLIGNPEATPKCDPVDFASDGSGPDSTRCPADTQVGYLNVLEGTRSGVSHGNGFIFQNGALLSPVAVYNLEPPKGVPADFGFNAGGFVKGHIYPALDPAQGYAIKTLSPDISNALAVRGAQVTFWGVPGDPAHDKFRFYPSPQNIGGKVVRAGAPFGSAPVRPLLTTPADCGFDNGGFLIRADSYGDPGNFTPTEESPDPLNVGGCEDQRFRFEPEITLQPTSRDAGGPTGLDVHLEVPQRDDAAGDANDLYEENGDVQGISTPPIKKAVVTMPAGMTISPSAALGLGSCSPEQIGLGSDDPVRCPDNSQYGTLTLHTPILPENAPPKGFVYIAEQNNNPFHEFLALYLVIEEPERGILVKIPGRVNLDPVTGQIKTSFDDLPQFPVSDMQLTLKGGVRAALVNPSTCGRKTITAEFFSWHDPERPHVVEDGYEITRKPDGSPCVDSLAQRPFKPDLDAGTINPSAGSFSPFSFRLTKSDDDQEFSQLGVTLPPGLIAKLSGVGSCSDAAIARAEAPGRSGFEEKLFPSCPASSLIGSTDVGAGVGASLTYVPGKVYLAGPYRGAPLSMVVVTPAVVGPYDLGVIAVRSALRIDPQTTQASVASDPFPLIFKGIPVRVRDLRVSTDRPNFTINPTSCAEMAVTAHVTGTGGDLGSTADDTAADLSERFQAANCESLPFKPRLSFRLLGGTTRGSHPKFRAVLKARPGDANIGRASVALPPSEFLDQGHIRTVCTRVQFVAEQCPAGSIYGFARATTPLLDEPLEGPVYLRSSSHTLPDLVAALSGRIDVNVVGRIDSYKKGIRNTFDLVPDAPVDSFVLTMQGGKRGLLVNSTNLCGKTNRAIAKFTAQSGKALTLRPKMQSACDGKAAGKKSHPPAP